MDSRGNILSVSWEWDVKITINKNTTLKSLSNASWLGERQVFSRVRMWKKRPYLKKAIVKKKVRKMELIFQHFFQILSCIRIARVFATRYTHTLWDQINNGCIKMYWIIYSHKK